MKPAVILGLFIFVVTSGLNAEIILPKIFPKDFLFGVGTSAYQIEGAWNEDGKAESIWDRLVHTRPELIADKSNGDVACDSYHQVKRDVEMLKYLGVNFYRFSLAWTRILPNPTEPNNVNPYGINYYNTLINLLLKNGIQPVVTLFHWDLPQSLEDDGGFTNSLIINPFVDYAKVAFQHFGDRVKLWTTFNEPHVFCQYGYGDVILAPAYNQSGVADYLCTYNLLKAHAAVYHYYNDTLKPIQKGRISINLSGVWYEPGTTNAEDVEAAERGMAFDLGMYSHPIYSESGDFPEVLKKQIAERSLAEGFPQSRLPEFTEEEIKYIRGTSDYFCLNHYSTALVTNKKPEPIGTPSFLKDRNINLYYDPSWQDTAYEFSKVTPWGLRKLLNLIKDRYGDPEIHITENGRGDFGELFDFSRAEYLRLYLNAVLEAIYKDKVRVKGYAAWSVMDNFEWSAGYTVSFGLYDVDFSDPLRKRTPKASALYYKTTIATRLLV